MIARLLAALLLMSSLGLAQMSGSGGPAGPPPDGRGQMSGPRGGRSRPMGRWWKNADVVQKLGLTDEQVQRIEKIFQDHRLRLIDVRANLERAEVTLQPMIESDNPDEAAVMKQIDKVAAQRAELEKANAQMLFAVRRVLGPEQWKKLQALQPQGRTRMGIPGAPPPGGGRRGGGPGPGAGPGPGGAPPAGGNQPED
jgi:Spy/CpxP family protein refolding chaperone